VKFGRIGLEVNKLTHTFNRVDMTSFHVEKCYHLTSAHAASARQQHPPVPDIYIVQSYFYLK